MSKIFINYRRDDTSGYAGRIYDRLAKHFGEDQIFMDIEHIGPGADFVEVINEKIAACRALIVLIGPQWLIAPDETGARRIPTERISVEEFLRFVIKELRVQPIRNDWSDILKSNYPLHKKYRTWPK